MSLYLEYIEEINNRKNELGLAPKPIDNAELLAEIIEQIKDKAYADKFKSQGKSIHLIGVEFSKESRNIVAFDVESAS